MAENRIVQLIYNRTAGKHRRGRLAELHSTFEARGARVILTECGPGADVAISEEASHVCALGGDGTIRHVALALHRSGRSLPLGVYPAGTVNLLHRELRSPLKPAHHVEHVLSGDSACLHYSVEINDTLFLACASVGPDSRAVAALSPRLKRWVGKAAYVVSFCTLLMKWPRDAITLSHSGGEVTCEAFYVAKGRYFAGPWSFAPDAQLADPRLHVVALTRARRRDFARFAWAMLSGVPVGRLPGVVAFTCTELSATASTPLPVQADGDVVAALPAKMKLRPDPMPFC